MSEALLTPRYILRRNLAVHLLEELPRGRLLEVGCGQGELLPHLVRAGFAVSALEISPHAAEAARSRMERESLEVPVFETYHEVSAGSFDYVVALEVLEHIENDEEALSMWREWLAPGGRLLISVPAYDAKWSIADDFGGHYRRYERQGLVELLETSGFRVTALFNYGFPVTAFTGLLRPLFYRRRMESVEDLSLEERSLQSSLDSTRQVYWAPRLINALLEQFGRWGHLAQLLFRGTGLGDGFMAVAIKNGALSRVDGRRS